MEKQCKMQKYTIIILVLAICFGMALFYNYNKEVIYVINNNVYRDLEMTQLILLNINTEITSYEKEKEVTSERLKEIIVESNYYGLINTYNTRKYQHISKKLEYIDISSLDYYFTRLKDAKLSAQEVEFHKDNMLQISFLWKDINIDSSHNFFEPSKQLRKMLEETNRLSEKGLEKVKK